MQAGESNLLVVSRIRPMADAEVLMGASETAKVVGEKVGDFKHDRCSEGSGRSGACIDSAHSVQVVVLLDPSADIEDILRKNRSREKRYAFDHAFGPEATQVEVSLEYYFSFVVACCGGHWHSISTNPPDFHLRCSGLRIIVQVSITWSSRGIQRNCLCVRPNRSWENLYNDWIGSTSRHHDPIDLRFVPFNGGRRN